jgi:hypothetical protein
MQEMICKVGERIFARNERAGQVAIAKLEKGQGL